MAIPSVNVLQCGPAPSISIHQLILRIEKKYLKISNVPNHLTNGRRICVVQVDRRQPHTRGSSTRQHGRGWEGGDLSSSSPREAAQAAGPS